MNKSPQSRHSALTPYRSAIQKMQSDSISMSLVEIAAMITSFERERFEETESILQFAANNDLLPADARTLEWCLIEHGKLFGAWIDAFQRKLFKLESKKWLAAILTGYCRINRLTLLSKIMRGDPSNDFIFTNLMAALDVSIKHKVLAIVADPPYGDGKETTLGSLITCALLSYTRGPHATPNDSKVLHDWIFNRSTKTTVSEVEPQSTDATWIIDLNQNNIPSKFHNGADNNNVWYIDATPIKNLMHQHLQDPVFAAAYTRLFTPPFKKQSRSTKADFGFLDFEILHSFLTAPHSNTPPKTPPASLFSRHSTGAVFSFELNEYEFQVNQMWIARPKKDDSLHFGVIRHIENEDKIFVHLEWVGKNPIPVEILSEWSDVADSNRPSGWVKAILIEPINNSSILRLITPHMNTISGEVFQCRAPGDNNNIRNLKYTKLLSIHQNYQIVDATRDF